MLNIIEHILNIQHIRSGADTDTDLVAMTVHLQLQFIRKKKEAKNRRDREKLNKEQGTIR